METRKIFSYPGIHDFLFCAVMAAVLALQLDGFADDPGLGWHLANGALMLDGGGIPRVDPFLAYEAPRVWVADQWLSDAILAAARRAGSWPLLYAVLLAAHFFTFLFLLPRMISHRTGSCLAALAVSLIAFKLSQVHLIARPTVFSFLFFAGTYGFVMRREKFGIAGAAALAAFFIAWANLHPAFVLGLFLLFVDVLIRALTGRDYRERQLVFGAAALATFINPYGQELHRSIMELGRSSYFMSLNSEWQPIELQSFEGALFLVVAALSAAGVLSGRRAWNRERTFELVIFAVFFTLTLKSVRFLPYFAIAAAFPAARGLAASAATLCRSLSTLQSGARRIEAFEARASGGALGLAAAVLSLGGSLIFTGFLPLFKGEYGPSRNAYPYASLDRLAAAGEDRVVLAHPNWGGFITLYASDHNLGSSIKAVIDDRNTMLGEKAYLDFFERMRPGSTFLDGVQVYNATHLLLAADSKLGGYLMAGGQLPVLHTDAVALLFLMHDGKTPKP